LCCLFLDSRENEEGSITALEIEPPQHNQIFRGERYERNLERSFRIRLLRFYFQYDLKIWESSKRKPNIEIFQTSARSSGVPTRERDRPRRPKARKCSFG